MNRIKWILNVALIVASIGGVANTCGNVKAPECPIFPTVGPVPKMALVATSPTCSPFIPAPSFTTAGVIIGDGVREVGIDMPAGTWLSTNIPADTPKCVWFVTPNPSKDPATQNLPSYTEFKKQHHQIRVVLEPGMGFTTAGCGTWELTSPMVEPEPSDVR